MPWRLCDLPKYPVALTNNRNRFLFRTRSGISGHRSSGHFRALLSAAPSHTGPDVHIYSIEDIIVDVNAECSTAVSVEDVDMEFSRAEVADATPTSLRRAVEAGGYLPAIVRWSRSQPPSAEPLPWLPEFIPAATPAPPGASGAIAFATTTQPAARFEGLTNTITRVNAIESALAEMARAQARTSETLVQLTTSVTALVQHAGIANALPAPPPTPAPRTFAAIAAAPAPAQSAPPPGFSAPPTTGPAAVQPRVAPGVQWHESMTPASDSTDMHTGATPCAEIDLNDDSDPTCDAPVARRTRFAMALASLMPNSAETVATAGGKAKSVRWADQEDWSDEYDEATDTDERSDSDKLFFGEDDDGELLDGDDAAAGGELGVDDDTAADTAKRSDESNDDYEARLNALVPPTEYFCCRPVFS